MAAGKRGAGRGVKASHAREARRAENRARHWAQQKLIAEALGQLTKWDRFEAMRDCRVVATSAGINLDAELAEIDDPVLRARRGYELTAPIAFDTMTALMYGTPLPVLDRLRGGARLLIESCVRALGFVGIRGGEVMEHELSDRFKDALSRFYGGAIIDGDATRLDETPETLALEPPDPHP